MKNRAPLLRTERTAASAYSPEAAAMLDVSRLERRWEPETSGTRTLQESARVADVSGIRSQVDRTASPAGGAYEVRPRSTASEILRRLERAGAQRETDRLFEDNRIFDFPDRRLRDREIMFRLRQSGDRWITTLKERVADEGDFKIRREYESEVSDGEAMLDVIRGLGMKQVYRYQKYRSTFHAGETVITLDELPIGNYLELEGPREAIDRLAAELGFSREDYISADYRTLHKQMVQQESGGDEPAEMIFPGRNPS